MLHVYPILYPMQMARTVPVRAPKPCMAFAALKQKGKFDPIPWKQGFPVELAKRKEPARDNCA